MSGDVHADDAYGRLVGLCARREYELGLATHSKAGMELRVDRADGEAQVTARFTPGRDNAAAASLLKRLEA